MKPQALLSALVLAAIATSAYSLFFSGRVVVPPQPLDTARCPLSLATYREGAQQAPNFNPNHDLGAPGESQQREAGALRSQDANAHFWTNTKTNKRTTKNSTKKIPN